MSQKTLSFFLAVLLIVPAAKAQEAERGRLPDGRAYRTQNGVQLVDYVAELELTVEQQKRRIIGLEDELTAWQQKSARIERSGGSDSGVIERDLVGTSDALRDSGPGFVAAAPAAGCPPPQVRVEKVIDYSACPNSAAAGEYTDIRQELEDLKVARERARISYEDEMAQLRAQIVKQQQALSEKEKLLAATKVHAAPASNAQAPQFRATGQSRSGAEDEGRAQLSPARLKALAAVRATVNSEVNRLRGLISTRDAHFKKYRKSNSGGVAFSLSPLVSERRYSLDRVRTEIGRARTVHELSALQRDLREIQSKVQDDLALITRMTKMNS